MESITAKEILQALEEALENAQRNNQSVIIDWAKGVTTQELADHLGRTKPRALKLIRDGIKAGVLECGGRAKRLNITGGVSIVPVYRAKSPEEDSNLD